ncbi:MAG: protein-L-isoaspartate(D-aspartate) O-methyltransferase [Bacteroidetes bacterium]|nr:protein-L-isoaspartate(D-aspartate) O-methyltransferase [Bacteroidota bacterium]
MKASIRQDTYRHQGLRNQLIRTIQKKGISDPAVLAAMEKVPRHFFFDSSFLEYAYEDQPFPIGAGQTISQPYTVAFQTSLLMISKGEKILEIGTGSGYQACILAELGAKVFSIERQKTLYEKTSSLLAEMGYQRIKLFYGDGYKGLLSYAPFDKVLVTAAAPRIPEALIRQMKPGGILVIPVGDDIQIMTTIHKISETEIRKEEHGHFRFVPMLEDKARDH